MFLDYIYTRLVVVVLPSLVYIYSQTQYILLSLPLNYCPLLFTGTLVLPQVRVQHSTLIPTSFKCFIKASDLYSPPASNIHSFIVVLYWFFINTSHCLRALIAEASLCKSVIHMGQIYSQCLVMAYVSDTPSKHLESYIILTPAHIG